MHCDVMTSLSCAPPAELIGSASAFTPRSSEDIFLGLLLRPHFLTRQEKVVLIGFDAANRLTHLIEISAKSADRCFILPGHWRSLLAGRRIMRALLAHNHPSGNASPSQADLYLTRDAATHLQFFAVDLIDHLILVADGHFSFARAGLL